MENQNDALAKAVEKGIALAEQTGEFVIDQAPELLQQFYWWHTAEHIMLMALGLLMTFAILMYRRMLTEYSESCDTINLLGKQVDYDWGMGGYAVGGPLSVIGIYLLFANLFMLIKLIVAPKIYLIEYFL